MIDMNRKQRKEIGQKMWRRRKRNMLVVKPLLIKWNKKSKDSEKCVACNEDMKLTLDTHHVDPNRNKRNYNSPENKVSLCASCHRIMDKAKYPLEVEQAFKKRHRMKR
jgi:hypothetical protein